MPVAQVGAHYRPGSGYRAVPRPSGSTTRNDGLTPHAATPTSGGQGEPIIPVSQDGAHDSTRPREGVMGFAREGACLRYS